jgi:hypothetical protein
MRRIRAVLFLGIFLTVFLLLPFFFLLHKKLAYYCYREITYSLIVNSIVGKERDPEKIAELLLGYCYNDLFSPQEAVVVDKDVYTELFRGIAFCDQRAWVFGTFAGMLGIDNRMVLAMNPDGVSRHVMSELFIDKNWRFFDPSFGFVVRKSNGELASYDDICNDLSLFYLSPPMRILKEIEPDKYQKVKDYFARDIFNKNIKPGYWGNPIRSKDIKRKIIAGVLYCYAGFFGKNFCYLYQDLYLKYFSSSGSKREDIFNRARNYDLFKRYRPAIAEYRNFIDNFPKAPEREDALFFLGTLYYKMKIPIASLRFFRELSRQYPSTKWRRMALYYSGCNYELLRDPVSAKDCYQQAIDKYREISRELLISGEMKVIQRLHNISYY